MGAFDPGMAHSDIRLLQKPASGQGFAGYGNYIWQSRIFGQFACRYWKSVCNQQKYG